MALVRVLLALAVASIGFADTLMLRSGQVVTGTYVGGTARQIRMEVGGQIESFNLSEVSALTFVEQSSASAQNTNGSLGGNVPEGAKTVTVPGRQPWTPSGIFVGSGDSVTISAAGGVSFSTGDPPVSPPAGLQQSCRTAFNGPNGWRAHPYVANELSCLSLLGRIGENGSIFYLGAANTFRADTSGQLYFGVNDNIFADNSGNWTVSATTVPATGRDDRTRETTPTTNVMLSDNFAQDRSLNDSLWITDTPLLKRLYGGSPTWIEPQIRFSNLGMAMSGLFGTNQVTGFQSRQSLTPPFTARVTVEGTVSNGFPFVFGVTSGNTKLLVAGDLNSNDANECAASGQNYGVIVYPAFAGNVGQPANIVNGGILLASAPKVNVWYTIVIRIDAGGNTDVVIEDRTGAVLGTVSQAFDQNINLGRGPFYLILGQREGTPCLPPGFGTGVGPNSSVWSQVEVLGVGH